MLRSQMLAILALLATASGCASMSEAGLDRTGPYCGVVIDLAGVIIGVSGGSPELTAVALADLPISLVVNTVRLPVDIVEAASSGVYTPCHQ